MELVAFSGYARAGKDEAAKALAELGFVRLAFADKLRDFLMELNPVVVPYDDYTTRIMRVSDIIAAYGWDGYKITPYGKEVRELLQRLGTECGRKLLYENVWVDATLTGLNPKGKYVITDCRFPNEAAAVRSKGGRIFRITRDGVGPANDHPSETSLDTYAFDGWIENNGNLEEYHDLVRRTVCE